MTDQNEKEKNALEMPLASGRHPIFKLPENSELKLPVSVETIKRVIDCASKEPTSLKLLIFCGLYLGLRHGETTHLKSEHYYWRDGKAWLFINKTTKWSARLIRVSNELTPLFDETKYKSRSPWIFPTEKNDSKPAGEKRTWLFFNRFRVKHGFNKLVYGDLREFIICQKLMANIEMPKISFYYGISFNDLNYIFRRRKHQLKPTAEYTEECAELPTGYIKDL